MSNQLLFCSLSYFSAFVKIDNAIGVFNGREAMGDNNLCNASFDLLKGLFDVIFRSCVERRCCFIHDENGGIFNKGTGDRKTLLLTSRKGFSSLCKERSIAAREFINEFSCMGHFSCPFDLFLTK